MSTETWAVAGAVVAGSAIGAPARYLLDQVIQSRHERIFPWGTFVINVTGSFLLGLLVAIGARGGVDDWALAAVGTGFLGSYTTFSTFTWETMRLVEDGALLMAFLNVTASVVLGLAAAWAGLLVGAL